MSTKIAILSDIHGNSWALQEVLKDISKRRIMTILNLGDSLYGPLDPAGTFELLKQRNCISISGNEDRLLLETNHVKDENNPTIGYVRSQLEREAVDWLHALPQTLGKDEWFLCHGTPTNDEVYLFEKVTPNGMRLKNEEELEYEIRQIPQHVICCGHSHLMRWVRLSSGKYLINPGSVGLPAYSETTPFPHKMESGSPKASYCILAQKKNRYIIDHITLPYDHEKAARCAENNNRRDWAKWLRHGTV